MGLYYHTTNFQSFIVMQTEHLSEVDIHYTKEQEEFIEKTKGIIQKREILIDVFKKWPGNIVNYVIGPEFSKYSTSNFQSHILS